jgi:hypothetical protein
MNNSQPKNETDSITKSMEQNHSWETGSRSGDQEIPSLLWNQNVHKEPPLHPILSQLSPIHIFTLYFFKINCNSYYPHIYA